LKNRELTEEEYWDHCWEKVKLPVEVKKDKGKSLTKEMMKIFDQYLPQKKELSILEIGGAPGQWLIYFKKYFHYEIHAIDYSKIGCEKMQENFDMLNIEATIHRCNLFSDDISKLPQFDIVYSNGFIEHFTDLNLLFKQHLSLLKDGGILMLGVPNFLGITQYVLRKTAPKTLSQHNLKAMDLKTWEQFEEQYALNPIFKGYIGGFNLEHCRRCENRTLIKRLVRLFFKLLTRLTERLGFLRRFNSKHWSPYLIGIYTKG
jgi:cyclopropane fatty-acyl-phospholipid synthase-like methyltransferase